MAHLYVEAVVHMVFGDPALLVSVVDSSGAPVSGLRRDDFMAGVLASKNHVAWNQLEITIFTDENFGFYSLGLALVNPSQPWSISSDWVLTVAIQRQTDQGQTLAVCHLDCSSRPSQP